LRSGQVALAAVVNALARKKTWSAILRQAQPILDEISKLLPFIVQGSLAEKSLEPAEIDAGTVPEDEVIPGLEQILDLASREGYKAEDIQAFWEPERGKSDQDNQHGEGRLSFDQARMLGLTPHE
jgi:hypothetical protein